MLEITELSIDVLRLQTGSGAVVVGGLTFIRLVLLPTKERVVLDRLVLNEEGVRQLAVDT